MIFQKSACIETLYTELPFLERFRAARADGFEFVEFWSWTDKDLAAVKAAADDAGVGISGFNGDAELSLIDPAQKTAYKAFLRRSLDAAMEIGARSVTVHSNGLGEGGRVLCPYDDLSDAVKLCTMFDTLKIAAEWAETCGVRINLEPLNVTTDHPGNFLRHTRTAAELTRLIGSPYLKVLYDVYHMQLNEGSLCDHIRAYADQFGHIHVADAPGRHEPGTGEIYYPAVFAALEQAGYRMLEGVLLAMLHEGRRVMEDPHNYEARANIMWAGMVCHNDIMGVGRQQDWNSHHLEHVLSAKYDCAHGAGLAVIMPAWMRYCAEHGGEKRLAQMAVRVFGCQMDFDDPKRTALEGIEAFRAFLRSIGMPLTFAEIGADPADIPELVEMNHIGDGKTGGYIGLDKQAHFDIYNLAAGSCVPET